MIPQGSRICVSMSETRGPRPRPQIESSRPTATAGFTGGRLVAGIAVFLIAAVSIGVVYLAFRRAPEPAAPPVQPTLRANGPIWFLGGDEPGSVFGPSSVYRVDPTTGTMESVPTSGDLNSITGLAVSPDGGIVALSNGGGEFPPRNIYVMGSDGSDVRQITSGEFSEVAPDWSPDGSRIVFSSTRCCATESSGGNYALYTMDPDGSDLRQLTSGSESDVSPAWSPDGNQIAYVRFPTSDSSDTNPWQIWVLNADGTDPRRLTNEGRYDDAVAWSPTGRELAYISHLSNDEDWEVRVIPVEGGDPRTIFQCSRACIAGGFTFGLVARRLPDRFHDQLRRSG